MAALDNYEARMTMARMRYRQACEDLASLPDPNRASAEAMAFKTLQTAQQEAMRELAASEFASLLELREKLAERLSPQKGRIQLSAGGSNRKAERGPHGG
jgi:hypothetical protein